VQSVLTRIPYTKIRRHSSSVLARLDEERKTQLNAWLKNSVPYRQIVERMRKEWDVKTHIHSLSVYYHKLIAAELLEERQKRAGVAHELNNAILKKPSKFSNAIFELVAGTYFDLLKNNEAHPKIIEIYSKQYQRLLDFQLRDEQVKIKKRRITLLEKQAAEARAAVQDSKLSTEEQAERIRQIFKPRLDEPDEAQTNGNGFKDGKERATHD
jgi:hypothetical protein